MKEEAEHWINRYLNAYMVVTRQISARVKERIPEGLTNDQFIILRLINSQELCTSTFLAEAVAVGKSSITAIINRLDEAGLIQRTRDENDRRHKVSDTHGAWEECASDRREAGSRSDLSLSV